MIKIICTSCQKPLSLDETKLPMKEVNFPCPACKAKLTVDRRKLEAPAAAPAATAPVTAVGDATEPHLSEDEGFGAKALIVGNENPALREAVKLIGFIPKYIATPQQARDYYLQDFPQLVVLSPGQLTPPPLESMQPIVMMTPADRRRSFYILVADGLRTLDGNAAFLYGVNLVVAQKDLGAFPQIYKEAMGYHERLYSSMNAVAKSIVTA